MARYVIDALTLVDVVDRGLTVDPAHQLVAPTRLRSEALELLLSAVLRGDREEQSALAAHERMTQLKIRVLGDRVSRAVAWKLAREHGWGDLRHAEYIAVATLQADALITLDADLAAKAEGVVAVAAVPSLVTAS